MKLEIVYRETKSLIVPEWRATYILRPDLLVLSASLMDYGFTQPIQVRKSTGEIIDGSERFLLATQVGRISEVVGDLIPVVEHDVDSLEAMLMHLRFNRGRGSVVAKPMSNIVKKLVRSRTADDKRLDRTLCMKREEYSLMVDGSLVKARDIRSHSYARAWVPVEAPPGTVGDTGISIESPPNADR
jgi:hypothetical protein